MSLLDDVRRESFGLIAQAVVFLVGLCVSLGVGMELSAHTDGPLLLVFVTVLAGLGLIGAAIGSQMVHDHIVYGREQRP